MLSSFFQKLPGHYRLQPLTRQQGLPTSNIVYSWHIHSEWRKHSCFGILFCIFCLFVCFFVLFYDWSCCTLYVYLCSKCIKWPQKPEESFRSSETGWQMVVSNYVGARNWISVLWKSSRCSWPLNHCSTPVCGILEKTNNLILTMRFGL